MTALQALSIHEDAVLECNKRNVNTASLSVTICHLRSLQYLSIPEIAPKVGIATAIVSRESYKSGVEIGVFSPR